jgi:hypothetical protein
MPEWHSLPGVSRFLVMFSVAWRNIINKTEQEAILRLLRQNGNMGEIALQLKERSLTYSATGWDELFEKRITPAIESGKLDRNDLVNWLRDAEEYGRQHVFLYECSKNAVMQIVNENVVTKTLDSIGRKDLLNKPRILEIPPAPTITDVRIEQGIYGRALVVKVVEMRTHERFVGEQQPSDNRILREYEKIATRAVSIARVHEDGFAELRVYSHRNKTDYGTELQDLWSQCNIFVPKLKFDEVSIGPAKRNLWQKRRLLSKSLRYSSSLLRDTTGATVSAASGSAQLSLLGSNAAKSLDAFWDDDATCDRSNVWWVKGDPNPSRDIHTLLSGAVNEFAVPTGCSRKDYDYVLDQLRKNN